MRARWLSTNMNGGRVYLDFGTDWRTDFTATISPDDRVKFDSLGIDPRRYEGKMAVHQHERRPCLSGLRDGLAHGLHRDHLARRPREIRQPGHRSEAL